MTTRIQRLGFAGPVVLGQVQYCFGYDDGSMNLPFSGFCTVAEDDLSCVVNSDNEFAIAINEPLHHENSFDMVFHQN